MVERKERRDRERVVEREGEKKLKANPLKKLITKSIEKYFRRFSLFYSGI